jgi:hypothetical protein
MKRALFLAGICIALFSCINSKKLMDNTNIYRIYFGKRGGFTNIPMEYVMFEKGQLYKIQNDSLQRIRRVSRRKLDEIDSLINSTNFRELEINEPGNITYFIRLVGKDSVKEVNWSDSTDNNDLFLIYKTLLPTIDKKNKKQ